MSKKLFALIVIAGVLGLAACGGNTGSSTDGSTAQGSSTIKIDTSSLGDVLVDGSGRTLYMYSPDGINASSSKCTGPCANLWPKLSGKPKAGAGVDARLIGATSGTNQASYAGHLLYYYAKDGSAGDVNGQGINKIWYVLDGKGTEITKAPSNTGGDTGNSVY